METSTVVNQEVKTGIWLLAAIVFAEFTLFALGAGYLTQLGIPALSRENSLLLWATYLPLYMALAYGFNWLRGRYSKSKKLSLIIGLTLAVEILCFLLGAAGIASVITTEENQVTLFSILFALRCTQVYVMGWMVQSDLLQKKPLNLVLLAVRELLYFVVFMFGMSLSEQGSAATAAMNVALFLSLRALMLIVTETIRRGKVLSESIWAKRIAKYA